MELCIDDILIKGMTYSDFDWETAVISLKEVMQRKSFLKVDQSRVTYTIAQPQHLSISLFTTMGSRVATLFNGNAVAGTYSIPMNDGAKAASGTYVLKLIGESAVISQPVTIVK